MGTRLLGVYLASHWFKMGQSPLNVAEWEAVLAKMLRYHDNISKEIGTLVIEIKAGMKSELVPVAEDKANYGKIVKTAIRSMWALEYEIEGIQKEFLKMIGGIDINNLTDDFVEDVMLQSKPLQGILMGIRLRQAAKMEEIKKDYNEKINALEPLSIKRPPKPEPKPELQNLLLRKRRKRQLPLPRSQLPQLMPQLLQLLWLHQPKYPPLKISTNIAC